MLRNYSFSNLAMLKTSSVVYTNTLDYLPDFAEVTTKYPQAYVEQKLAEVRTLFGDMGMDMVTEPSANRQSLENLRVDFKKLQSKVLTSAKQGFVHEPERFELLIKPLDLTRLLKSDSDEAVAELALNFVGSIDSQRAAYTDALDRLRITAQAYSDLFLSHNSQIRRAASVSSETQALLNAIYTDALGISTIAQTIFSGDRSKLKLFTFSSIAKNYRSTRRKKAKAETSSAEDFAQSIADAIAPIIEDKVEQELLIVNRH